MTEVIPGCSLAELTALEAILTALAQQGSLAAPVLVHLCVETLCSHYATLQEQQQAEKKQQPGGRQRGGPQKQDNDTSASAMDTETDGSGATQSVGAGNVDNSSDEKPDEEKLTRADSVQPMRDVSALLSMLAAAQPGAIKAKYVQFLLQVGFAPDLAVSLFVWVWFCLVVFVQRRCRVVSGFNNVLPSDSPPPCSLCCSTHIILTRLHSLSSHTHTSQRNTPPLAGRLGRAPHLPHAAPRRAQLGPTPAHEPCSQPSSSSTQQQQFHPRRRQQQQQHQHSHSSSRNRPSDSRDTAGDAGSARAAACGAPRCFTHTQLACGSGGGCGGGLCAG